MTHENLNTENVRPRDQIAAFKAAPTGLITVEIAGLKGLHDLSKATENEQFDGCRYERGVPDKVYFGIVWVMLALAVIVVALGLFDSLSR